MCVTFNIIMNLLDLDSKRLPRLEITKALKRIVALKSGKTDFSDAVQNLDFSDAVQNLGYRDGDYKNRSCTEASKVIQPENLPFCGTDG